MKVKCIFLLLMLPIFSFSQTWEWAKRYGVPLGVCDNGLAISNDKLNNLYITGNTYLPNSGPYSGWSYNWLKKFDNTGNLIWTDTINIVDTKIITDLEGNTFVAGNSMLAQYDTYGKQIWLQTLPRVMVSSIKFLENNLVISGYTGSYTTSIGATTLPANCGFIAKCDKFGNWLMVKVIYGYAPAAINVTGNGLIYCVGSNFGSQDSIRVKIYDSSGNYLRGLVKLGSLFDFITTDSQDNFYLMGGVGYNIPIIIGKDTITCDCEPTRYSTYLIKFNKDGVYQWYKLLKGQVELKKIETDKNDNIYIGGSVIKNLQIDDFDFPNYFGNVFIAKISANSEVKWIKTNTGENNNPVANSYVGSFVFDSEQNVLLTGSFSKKATFDNHLLVGDPNYYPDVFIAKLKNDNLINVSEHSLVFSNGLNVYPNPTNGLFTAFYSSEKSTPLTLKIINPLGQVILVKQYPEQKEITETFDLSRNAKGIYLIRVITNDANEVRKIILN